MALPNLSAKILEHIRKPGVRSLGNRRPTLYPSQARSKILGGVVGTCLRSAFWSKTGETKTNEVSDGVSLMAYMGNEIEDGLIDLCKDMGMWVANSVKWYNERENVSGEIDVVLDMQDEVTGETVRINVECKSCMGYYINKEVFGHNSGRGKNKVYIPGKPKDKHLMQSALYADITKDKHLGTLLIYFSRDESKMKEFMITIGNDGGIYIDGRREERFTIQDIYESYGELQEHLDSGELPDRDYKPHYQDREVADLFGMKKISKTVFDKHNSKLQEYRDKECEYCSFQDKCLSLDVPVNETPEYLAHGSF